MKRYPPYWMRLVVAAMLVSLLAVSGAYGQTQTGNIIGTVVGTDGAALPGVTVTLTGIGAPQTTVTDSQGFFRFPNLSPGTYALKGELSGYGTAASTGIAVSLGSLPHGDAGGFVVRQGLLWHVLVGAASALMPLDILSGAPGMIDFCARKPGGHGA